MVIELLTYILHSFKKTGESEVISIPYNFLDVLKELA